jgi:hypothetical protein
VYLAQFALAAGVIAATLLQFVGALCVREYAKALWMKELREEARMVACEERRSLCVERRLPVIFEEDEMGEKVA